MKTVFVTDLDGTLLRPDGTLSPGSRDALCELIDAGVHLMVATARSPQSVQTLLRGVRLRLPTVNLNGAVVHDPMGGRDLQVFAIADAAARRAYALGLALGLAPMVSTRRVDGGAALVVPERHNPGTGFYLADRIRHRDPRLRLGEPASALGPDVVCLFAIDHLDPLAAWREALLAELPGQLELHLTPDLYQEGWYWLTLFTAVATKGRAARWVMDREGLGDHRMVAFGDNVNDLSMFAAADHAVAMGNAVPDALRAAHQVIGPNTDDAVVRAIFELAGR